LFGHQGALIREMALFERRHKLEGGHTLRGCVWRTRLGILAARPGAGKTLAMLSFLLSVPVVDDRSEVLHEEMLCNTIPIHVQQVVRYDAVVKTSLVVVPNMSSPEWVRCVDEFVDASESILIVRNVARRDADRRARQIARITSGAHCVVIITDNVYREIAACLCMRAVVFQRFVVDNADTINLGSEQPVPAHFNWFITASPSDVLCNTSRVVRAACGPLVRRVLDDFLAACCVRCDDAFVARCTELPPCVHEEHVIKPCLFSNVFAVAAMREGDAHGVARALGCDCVETRHAAVDVLMARGRQIRRSREAVEEQVFTDSDCPVTLSEIRRHAYLACCCTAFEMSSVVQCAVRRDNCPMCRAPISIQDVVILNDQRPLPLENDPYSTWRPPINHRHRDAARLHMDCLRGVFDNILTNRAAAGRTPRILLFSAFSQRIARRVLSDLGLTNFELKGHPSTIQLLLQRFQNVDTPVVILLSVAHWAPGLSISCATDVVLNCPHAGMPSLESESPLERLMEQVVGRAHRIDREEPLHVHHVVNKPRR
jgi:hypothetical protein